MKDNNILVTGASSGIGASCSIACSESGANLILLGRNQEKLDHIMSQLSPGNHSSISIDLTGIEDIENSLEDILNKYGKIHGFVHSAGIDMTLPLNALKHKDYKSIFSTNVISGFELARVLSKRRFCPISGASYIFIASVMGLVGEVAKVAYSASKGALLAGCRSMALELATKKIRVNCISPAIVQTDLVNKLFEELPKGAVDRIKSLHPLGIGSPEDIANACVFLLSIESKWITGSNIVIDGGYSCQ
ncbi:MAG: SDR family oxidoreductase [Bacteroidales bacterium]|nr:SDR family oxidoreductase [Bacteroidales bacterium]